MTERLKVYLIDDEVAIRRVLGAELSSQSMDVESFGDVESAREDVAANPPDVLVLDLRLPGVSGEDYLVELRESQPDLPVVLLTGHADVELAVECMKRGASDLVTKPCSVDHLAMTIRRAADVARLRETTRVLTRQTRAATRSSSSPLIGSSAPMKRLGAMIERVAASEEPVLVIGESGTGKELIAHALRDGSARADQPFITVNCAAVTETLLESELFGHEKGAFSGAVERRLGYFEIAHEGTIFLDEIGDMPLSMQPKLLRVLQSGEFRRVGGGRTLKADVRVIAATNRSLHDEVREGNFREDLFHRINTIQLDSPALRERIDDLEELIESFLEEIEGGRKSARTQGERHHFSPGAMAIMRTYGWPGNVRELRNIVRRCVILSEGLEIEADALPRHLTRNPDIAAGAAWDDSESNPLELPLEEVERRHILAVLRDAGGNKTQAAKRLGVSVKTLYNKLEAWGLSVADIL